jgi:hypothetical protein
MRNKLADPGGPTSESLPELHNVRFIDFDFEMIF